jgi:hypothetical protein
VKQGYLILPEQSIGESNLSRSARQIPLPRIFVFFTSHHVFVILLVAASYRRLLIRNYCCKHVPVVALSSQIAEVIKLEAFKNVEPTKNCDQFERITPIKWI